MSFSSTTNYALQKPGVGTETDAWGDDINTNFDLIDARMKLNADAAAAASTLAGTKAAAAHTHPFTEVTGQATTAQYADTSVSTAKIAENAVTNAKLATMPLFTFKGNGTASTAVPTDLTATAATALLNQFTNTLKGLVPGSGGGTANFLRADSTWAAPSVPVGSVAWGAITGTLSSQSDLQEALVEEQPSAQTGSYTLVAGDAGKMVTFNSASGVNCAVNASVFTANSRVDVLQLGAGQVTFTGTATRRSSGSKSKLTGQYSGATLWFISASEYVLMGDIAT